MRRGKGWKRRERERVEGNDGSNRTSLFWEVGTRVLLVCIEALE